MDAFCTTALLNSFNKYQAEHPPLSTDPHSKWQGKNPSLSVSVACVSMADMNPTVSTKIKQLILMPVELPFITQQHYCATQAVAERPVPRVFWPRRIYLHCLLFNILLAYLSLCYFSRD